MVFRSLTGYRPAWLGKDVVAGMTVWAVLVPEALAYATIAGVPPVVGLYAAPAALVLYAAFGSSRHLVVGPMSATAALSAAVVAGVASRPGSDAVVLTAGLAVVAGVIAVGAGLLRLGFLAGFISEPVLKGFIVGLALTIIVGQLPKLLGVDGGDGEFFEKLWALIGHLGEVNGWSLAVGVPALLLVLVFMRYLPLVPASLIVVACGVLAAVLLGLEDRGVAVVGDIEPGLPSIGVPALALGDYLALVAGGAGIVLVGFSEGLGAAKTYAAKAGYDVDPNRELLGLGAANLGAGLMSGMVVNGSLSKTAVNGTAGARSQVSGLVVSGLTIVTLLVLTPLFEQLPEPVLAAVVIAAVIELVDVGGLRELFRVWTRRLGSIYGVAARADFLAALAALVGVLVFGTLAGLFVGIAMSALLLLYRASRPNLAILGRIPGETQVWADVARHPGAEQTEGVSVIRVESGLFFANAEHVRSGIREVGEQPGMRGVVLDVETVPFVDVTAARMLAALARDLDAKGVRLLLARDVGQVRDVLRSAGPADLVHDVHPDLDTAVREVTARRPSTGSGGDAD
ncbi:SulP family inorganic anion transporter [Saccharopolyspora karakumensis]|uniref:SulP family inorganic anion transporter n=1 Tax=Saccharopolyspora karakumensis TaxID=2530386 RepID=A0A4R5BYY1_9PSEU|nr:SulP family inorganic anion transporter [Saccharopolyspora karakumensis]